jgi:hypothetical protein
VGRIQSFEALLEAHGSGMGCDICKPAVASILASCWNEFVLKKEHASLQDSNDYFLANIQKDGTYSVVPRMPGGEVTADGLIAVGQVAKKYDLYTKITGGQRVDLFVREKVRAAALRIGSGDHLGALRVVQARDHGEVDAAALGLVDHLADRARDAIDLEERVGDQHELLVLAEVESTANVRDDLTV